MGKRKIFSLWMGQIKDIPDDWVLCDGDNDTPDLVNRFVLDTNGSVSPEKHIFKNTTPTYYHLSWVMKKN